MVQTRVTTVSPFCVFYWWWWWWWWWERGGVSVQRPSSNQMVKNRIWFLLLGIYFTVLVLWFLPFDGLGGNRRLATTRYRRILGKSFVTLNVHKLLECQKPRLQFRMVMEVVQYSVVSERGKWCPIALRAPLARRVTSGSKEASWIYGLNHFSPMKKAPLEVSTVHSSSTTGLVRYSTT